MNELKVSLEDRSYPIYIGEGLLNQSELIKEHIDSKQVMIVSNTTVSKLYLTQLMDALSEYECVNHILEDGEEYKTLSTFESIITLLLENKFSRDCCLIALGGGVVGDITGYVAASYQRGANFIQVPTTLLAQVDSSVGGKTAVNHKLGKNMIGAFYQPKSVIIDVNVLNTLPDREFQAGLAEVIKYGLIRDVEFFYWLEKNIDKLISRDYETLSYAIEKSCSIKAEIVSADERESGLRAILNLGHTFGHAIENRMNYKGWLHGEAVALGMVMAAEFSSRLGMLSEDIVSRIIELIDLANLPTQLPDNLSGSNLIDVMKIDKKARSGQLFLILMREIGEAYMTSDFDEDMLVEMLTSFPGKPEVA